MILRSSPASPFGRKIKIAAAILGLDDRIEVVRGDTTDPSDSLRQQNPLGKIPILITEDGLTLYDSPVIIEYLDMLAGGGKLIPKGTARFPVLTLQALADGIVDAAILQIYEIRFREEAKREPKWVSYQAEKVTRGLRALENEADSLGDRLDAGTIAVAVMLAYLDFRFEGKWRADHPKLASWLAGFESRVPAMAKTAPTG